jgi:DNA-directed RNA polymerase subunit RPC12/RpoP
MPRIIEENVPGTERTVIHKDCGTKVGYYPNEVKSYTHHDYGGGSDEVYYIVCPKCGSRIIVNRV